MEYKSKPHYELLDGLRGVAALMVICYHVFEGFATSPADQMFNHGYLAVDFFFILSGFVIGYAYDDRWKTMTDKEFFKRRLIRLHPMVVMGVVLGVITFIIQGCEKWDGTNVPLYWVFVGALLNLFLFPVFPGTGPEVRGNGEMFPLNGPNWSLFFEYIGNILYAFFIHKLSTRWLKVLVGVLGVGIASFALFNLSGYGNIGVGWTMAEFNFPGGLLRMLFSYTLGMLMARTFKPCNVKGAFLMCSIAIFAFLSVPHLSPDGGALWKNAIYEIAILFVIFPVILYLGASGKCESPVSSRICKFLGDISYPLYVVHYPFMYLFFSYVWKNGLAFKDVWYIALITVVFCMILAWVCLKFYDIPIRRRLSVKYLGK